MRQLSDGELESFTYNPRVRACRSGVSGGINDECHVCGGYRERGFHVLHRTGDLMICNGCINQLAELRARYKYKEVKR